ncbi:MAG: leucine-rich repeat domain-containing protein [Duncaniella sp.]|nr:leucine-rich repeat domain-containing protein [Duncaniella sp.]
MKKLLFILFAALTLVVSGCKDGNRGISMDEIQDPIFRAYLLENFDTDNDGEISPAEALEVTSIDVENSGIKSLEGLQYFTNLTYLNCYGNQLTTLDVSKNTALTTLYCSRNQLTALDVSKNTALTTLYCRENQLTTLDVSKTNLNGGWLGCKMSTLETLYLRTGWVIERINSNRNSDKIDPNTEILYKD